MANLFWLSGQAYVDTGGIPYASAKLYTYETGTTTNKATYSNAGLSAANANPVVAGADGVFGDIYCLAARYKFVLKTSADVTLQTWDPWDASLELIAASAAPSPTYPFLRYHNTTDGRVYRRDSTNASWIDEGPVDSIGNAASVTQQLAGTSTAAYSTPDSVAGLWQRGTDITPGGGSVSLPSSGGGVFNINAGNFAAISSAVGGRSVLFVFAGTSVITHHATSMILPGGADITTEAGDCALFVNEAAADASGSNWRCVWYERDSTTLAAVPNYAASQADMEAASSALRWVTPAVAQHHPSACKAWAYVTGGGTPAIAASSNITSVTDTGAGILTITIATDFSSVNWVALMSVYQSGANVDTWLIDDTSAQTAGVVVFRNFNSSTPSDPSGWGFAGFGDQ